MQREQHRERKERTWSDEEKHTWRRRGDDLQFGREFSVSWPIRTQWTMIMKSVVNRKLHSSQEQCNVHEQLERS